MNVYIFLRSTYSLFLCIRVLGAPCVCSWQERPEEGIRSRATGATDGCEPPGMGAGRPRQVFCKVSKVVSAAPECLVF